MNVHTLTTLRDYLAHCIQIIGNDLDSNPSSQSLHDDLQLIYTNLTKELDVLKEAKFSPDTHIRLESLHHPICQKALVRIVTTSPKILPTELNGLKTRLHELLPGFVAICVTLNLIDRQQLSISSSRKRKLYAYEQHTTTAIDPALLPALAASIESLSMHGALNQFTLDTLLASCDRTKPKESAHTLAGIFVAFKQTNTLWTTEHQSAIAQLPDEYITRVATALDGIQKITLQPDSNITAAMYLLLIKYPSRAKELDHVFHTLHSTQLLSVQVLNQLDLYLTKQQRSNKASLIELTNVLVQLQKDKQLTDEMLAYYANSQKPMALYKLSRFEVTHEVEREHLQKSSAPSVLHEVFKTDVKLARSERQLLQENLHPEYGVDILARLQAHNAQLVTLDLRSKILSYTPTHFYPLLSAIIDACIKADILDTELLQHLLTSNLDDFNIILSETSRQNLPLPLLRFAVLQSNPTYVRVTLQLLSTIPSESDAQQLVIAKYLYQIVEAYSINKVEDFFTYFGVDSNLKTLSDWLLVDPGRVDALIKIKSLLTAPKKSLNEAIESFTWDAAESDWDDERKKAIHGLREIDSKQESIKMNSRAIEYLNIVTQYDLDKTASAEHFSQMVEALASLPPYVDTSQNYPIKINKDEQKKLQQAIQTHPKPRDFIQAISLINSSRVFDDNAQAILLRQILTKSNAPSKSRADFISTNEQLVSYFNPDLATAQELQQRILTRLATIEGDTEQALTAIVTAIVYLAQCRLLSSDAVDIILVNPREAILNACIFHATQLLQKILSPEDSATIIQSFHQHTGDKIDLADAIIRCCEMSRNIKKKMRLNFINCLFTTKHPPSLTFAYETLAKNKKAWTKHHVIMVQKSKNPAETSKLLCLAHSYGLKNYSKTISYSEIISTLKKPVEVLKITNILKFISPNPKQLKIILDNADTLTQPEIFALLIRIANDLETAFQKLLPHPSPIRGETEGRQVFMNAEKEMRQRYSSYITNLWGEIGDICEPKQEGISASKTVELSPTKKISHLLLDTIAQIQQPLEIQRPYQLDEVLAFFNEDMNNVVSNIITVQAILTHPGITNLLADYINKLGRAMAQLEITYKFRAAANQHSTEQAIIAAREEMTQKYFPAFKQLWEQIADACKSTKEEKQDSNETHRLPVKKIAAILFQATSDPLLQDQQNVHTSSVSSSVIASFRGLHAKYAQEITPLTLNVIAQEIWGYVTGYAAESSQKLAAKRALLELFPKDFSFISVLEKQSCPRDRSSFQINLGNATTINATEGLMLAWCAATDEQAAIAAILANSPGTVITPDSIAKQIEHNKECFMRGIFLSQRAYSSSDPDTKEAKSKEVTIPDAPGCPDGTFSAIINGLTSVNTHVQIQEVTQEGAGDKLQHLARKKAVEYLAVLYRQDNPAYTNLRDKIVAEGIELIWEQIEQAVATLLLAEYGRLYPNGLADIRFQQTLKAGIYVALTPQDCSKLDDLLKDLQELNTAGIVLSPENEQLFIQHDRNRQKRLVTALQLSQSLELPDKDSFYKALITSPNPMNFLRQHHPALFASKAGNKEETNPAQVRGTLFNNTGPTDKKPPHLKLRQ